MTYFIFEDSDDVPVSSLLRQLYSSGNVLFANGNINLLDKLRSVYNDTDFFVIYVDLVPNNRMTIVVYNDLLHDSLVSNKDNILLVPVLCIEYYVLKMLEEDGISGVTVDYQGLFDTLIGNENFIGAIEVLNLSLEKLYKRLVANQVEKCTHNVNRLGEYYMSDCKCRLHCDLPVSKRLIDKSFSLWRLLPVMDDEVNDGVQLQGWSFRHLTVGMIKEERCKFFESIFRVFNKQCPVLYKY